MSDTPRTELKGTAQCDICGRDTPHSHDAFEIECERLIRPAFEKTVVPRNAFGRLLRTPGSGYSDQNTDQLWQHYIRGWIDSRRTLERERDDYRQRYERAQKAIDLSSGPASGVQEALADVERLSVERDALQRVLDRQLDAGIVFDAGWVLAANWANRSDLIADMDSPVYKEDKTNSIAALAARRVATQQPEEPKL